MLHRILCALGWHRWVSVMCDRRVCVDCGLRQRLEFYSNREHDWVFDDLSK